MCVCVCVCERERERERERESSCVGWDARMETDFMTQISAGFVLRVDGFCCWSKGAVDTLLMM